MPRDLSLARNVFGALSPAICQRLVSYHRHPNAASWADIKSIIVGEGGMTVWQAVVATVPGFPTTAPRKWEVIPTSHQLEQAVAFATH